MDRAPPEHRLCVVIHDVAPAHATQCRVIRDALAALGQFPVTLLAVPRFHGDMRDPDFEQWLRACHAAGDEVALHGYFHQDDGTARSKMDAWWRGVYTLHEGEFWALSQHAASERIAAGLAWLAELGIAPDGFVAPAWLLGPGARAALSSFPLLYTCTLRKLVVLPDGPSPACMGLAFSHRAGWRRLLSRLWAPLLGVVQHRAALRRLELHPGDWDHPALRRSWLSLCRRQLASRRACTLAQAAHAARPGPRAGIAIADAPAPAAVLETTERGLNGCVPR